MAKVMSKAAAKKAAKALWAQAGAIRSEWRVRGVAESEFEQVSKLEAEAMRIEREAGLCEWSQVDSLVR